MKIFNQNKFIQLRISIIKLVSVYWESWFQFIINLKISLKINVYVRSSMTYNSNNNVFPNQKEGPLIIYDLNKYQSLFLPLRDIYIY